MKTIKKGKLNLNRETLVELDAISLQHARGGIADGGEGGGAEPAISVVISNNCNSMVAWNCPRG